MIVGRIAKNSYTWYGRQRLEATLEELQWKGRQQGYHLQMELIAEVREGGPGCEDDGAEGDPSNGDDYSLKSDKQNIKFVHLLLFCSITAFAALQLATLMAVMKKLKFIVALIG